MHPMKNLIFILSFCISLQSVAQGEALNDNTYPTDYFRSPLEIPLLLSGTFGELRGNHFHAGLDIKTEQREGLKVMTAAPGYISRIKISHWGYGKAIYITHPNGYTTVYAHLQKFNDRIESYIRSRQYKKESFEIQVFLGPETLPVAENEVIAYSGATGGFVAPHLHFEIRDTKTEKPINPFYFGLTVADSQRPRVNTVMGYPLDNVSHINQTALPTKLVLTQLENGNFRARTLKAHGTLGFGVNSYDQLDGAYNKNGLYELEMTVNGKLVHKFQAGTFSFAESKYINLLIDYERYATLSQRVQKCFIEAKNILSMYGTKNNGHVTIEDGKTYDIVIRAKDFAGNSRTVTIPVEGKRDSILVPKTTAKTPYHITHEKFNTFTKGRVNVAFPSNTFYNDFYLDFANENDSIVQVHEPTIPLNKSYTLTFDVSDYTTEQLKHMYIAAIDDQGRPQYVSTSKKENKFYTSTKKMGRFALVSDTEKPVVTLKNIKDGQWITHYDDLIVDIEDEDSGIKSYRGEIDGKWILMEYNVKKGTLTYDLNDRQFTEAEHTLTVEVVDNAGNTNVLTATFYRKK
jgi:murein DD-endopeptidase MepM/ murein hydrolase activator NlpD